MVSPPEVGWFGALCDDDYEFLGLPDPGLASSWEHCRAITVAAESYGYDSILLPSGYALGIDSVAFAAAAATQTRRINLLLAVRMGEPSFPSWPGSWPPSIRSPAGGWCQRHLQRRARGGAPDRTVSPHPRVHGRAAIPHVGPAGGDVSDASSIWSSTHLGVDDLGPCPPFYFGGLSEEARRARPPLPTCT